MNLSRSSDRRILFGVCGGLADYFGWSANLLRAAFALFAFFGVGMPILGYALLAILMPSED
ncbi:MAG: PspC domain-containing protein [Bacteroidota bacterium]